MSGLQPPSWPRKKHNLVTKPFHPLREIVTRPYVLKTWYMRSSSDERGLLGILTTTSTKSHVCYANRLFLIFKSHYLYQKNEIQMPSGRHFPQRIPSPNDLHCAFISLLLKKLPISTTFSALSHGGVKVNKAVNETITLYTQPHRLWGCIWAVGACSAWTVSYTCGAAAKS